jgi:ATP-binding cassette subfamily B protein
MTTKIIPPSFITQSEEFYDKGYDPKVARGLLQFVKPYTRQMLLSLFFMVIVTTASVSGPYFVKLAIDEGITPNSISALRTIVLVYLVVSVIQLSFNVARIRLMSRV